MAANYSRSCRRTGGIRLLRCSWPGSTTLASAACLCNENGDIITVIAAEFKDINALLNSPYGRAHQLSVELDKDGPAVKGITGMEAAARMAEMKGGDGGMGMMEMMGMPGRGGGDMQKRAGEMRAIWHN
jgi:hypothetical protein